MKAIMIEAHRIAKTLEGDYLARLSEGLKTAWSNFKKSTLRILKETEKAILVNIGVRMCDNGEYRVVNGKGGFFKDINVWAPKSIVSNSQIPGWFILNKLREMNIRMDINVELF